MSGVNFNRHDTYRQIQRKFTDAWPNLRVEIHIADVYYHKEGRNEVDYDQVFMVEGQPDRPFALTDETMVGAAKDMITQNLGANRYSLATEIFCNRTDIWIYPNNKITLADANDPFFLHPKECTHAEFQRRFTEHWTNLSIEFFRLEISESGEPKLIELAPDFELKNLTGTGIHGLWRGSEIFRNGVHDVAQVVTENYLHDHLYISDYKNILEKNGVTIQVKNTRLGIYWNKISSPHTLIDFQNAAYTEE
jgi:hypothetical protein